MRLFLSKKSWVAILSGIVFLLGAQIVWGATVWAYQVKASAGESAALKIYSFPTQADCLAAFTADTTAPYKTSCQMTLDTMAAQVGTNIVQTQANAAANAGRAREDALLKGIHCGIPVMIGSPDNLMDCIPKGIYYGIYKPFSFFLIGCAYFFDTILGLSIDQSYVNQTFIDTSWKVIRDFSNMLFIFILLYTGISTIVGREKDWRGVVLKVVVIALLINFSLFFTKVVIDAGNVLAVGVRDSIQVGNAGISHAIASKFEPQSFLKVAGEVDTMKVTIVFLIAAVISAYAGYIFFRAGLLFLGRLIAFWFLMIVSPFAFISMALPKGNVFQKWLDLLINQSFVAPLFLFLIYLIMQIINVPGGLLGGIALPGKTGNTAWLFADLFAPIIMAVLIGVALQKALGLATKMSGEFGAATAKFAGAAMGLAGGAALGGTALALRGTVGRAAAHFEKKGTFQRMATNTDDGNFASRFLGRKMLAVNDKARTGTWDVRGADGFIGKNINKGISSTLGDIGKVSANAKGGFEGAKKRQNNEDLEMAKRLRMTEEEKEAINAKYAVNEKNEEKEKQMRNANERAAEVADAEEKAKNSLTGQALSSTEADLKKQKEETEKVTKEREGAEKALASAIIKTPAHQKAINDARIKEGSSLAALNQAQENFDSAKALHLASSEISELNTAKAGFEVIQKAFEAAKKEADSALTEAKKEIAKENKRRNEVYANYVEGRVKTVVGLGAATTVLGGLTGGIVGSAVGAGISNLTYSQEQVRATAAKIRAGEGPDESEKEMPKLVKELIKKMKEDEENKK